MALQATHHFMLFLMIQQTTTTTGAWASVPHAPGSTPVPNGCA